MFLKILALGGFQFIWGVSTSLHAMKFYRNLIHTKVVLLPWNFLTLRSLTSCDMSRSSKEIISLKKLYCFFKGFFLLRILLGILDREVFQFFLANLKMSLRLLEYFKFVRFCIFIFQIFDRKFWNIFHIFAPFDCLVPLV